VEWWKGSLKQALQGYILCHPGQAPLDQGSSALGWQSPFATETGGLFQTGNSVVSAEQTSAAQYRGNLRFLSAYICVNRVTRDPVPWGGIFRLPQRPEVSSKQATPLPLSNRLRQPLNYTKLIQLSVVQHVGDSSHETDHRIFPAPEKFGTFPLTKWVWSGYYLGKTVN
jgi:hypothetical protein